jgi:hypothetical protein
MACNRKNGGKIQCHTVPQGMPILLTPSRGSNPFSKVQCQIRLAEHVPGFTPQTQYQRRYTSIAHRSYVGRHHTMANN